MTGSFPAGMLSTLQDMLTEDKDAQVVANCMSVLQQVTHRLFLAYACHGQMPTGMNRGTLQRLHVCISEHTRLQSMSELA